MSEKDENLVNEEFMEDVEVAKSSDKKNQKRWYIVHTYSGYENKVKSNLEKRIEAHNAGKGAKYTKVRLPVELVYYEQFETKEEAMRREFEIKQLTRKQKDALIITKTTVNNGN